MQPSLIRNKLLAAPRSTSTKLVSAESPQMLRGGRQANLDRGDDLADGQRPPFARQQIQDLKPRRLGQTPNQSDRALDLALDHRPSTIAR